MAFPTTGVLDAFADTEGPPMTGWATPTGFAGLKSASGVCLANAANAFGIWNSVLTGADCEVYFTVTTATGAGAFVLLLARCKDTGSAGTIDGYDLSISEVATDTWALQVLTNGVPTTIGATFTAEVANGDVVGMRIVGNVLYAFLNGALVASRTDAGNTYPLAGYIGAAISDTTGRVDDFGGGEYVPSANPGAFMRPMGIIY